MIFVFLGFFFFFFFKQKTAYEIRKGDWSSDVCSSDLKGRGGAERLAPHLAARGPELGDALHRVELLVERHDARDIAARGEPGRAGHGHGVTRTRTSLKVGDNEGFEARRITDT